ncbi:MAG: motility associated factor glycosyltransferase family protein [Syntrophomonadaceae bacterium]|nr:motility associated factor glycosyltransferase family protein [Syntrophomonadaceae bacterium]
MTLVDNIVFMKERFPLIWDIYRANEEKQNQSLVEIQPSKVENYPTLCVKKEDRSYYIHSRYNPEREVASIIDNFNGEDYEHVIFYGVGLGYHITGFLEKYPHLTFSIYEPVPEVFKHFLSHFNLKDLPQRRLQEIVVETSPDDARAFLERTIRKVPRNILFFDLPSYRNIFAENHGIFLNLFKDIILNRRSSLLTDYALEKRWTINSLLNFKHVLNTPNIIVERKGAFKDKPAILVAAGPSLDYEIENLRYIKENGLAYIFSVGSAVNSLIAANIYPHAQCTYDPGEANQGKVFARITQEQISDIPLIFGSSVGHEVLSNYPGKHKFHMITSQDTVSSYLLKLDDETQLDGVMDAPSIAVVTLQLLYLLGFNPIILVGQNLAYSGDRHYAGGIAYAEEMKLNNKDKLIKVKDVEGKEIYTSFTFNQMRINMEHYIKLMPKTTIINTTQGGAHIEGTQFRYLESLIKDKVLADKVVDDNWYDISLTQYDREYLRKQFKKLHKDYQELETELRSLIDLIQEINTLKEARNLKLLENSWPNLDKAFKRVKNNLFFNKVIQPMNRVSYELLMDQIPTIKFEMDLIKKAEMVVEYYSRLARASLADLLLMDEVMKELQELVEEVVGPN